MEKKASGEPQMGGRDHEVGDDDDFDDFDCSGTTAESFRRTKGGRSLCFTIRCPTESDNQTSLILVS